MHPLAHACSLLLQVRCEFALHEMRYERALALELKKPWPRASSRCSPNIGGSLCHVICLALVLLLACTACGLEAKNPRTLRRSATLGVQDLALVLSFFLPGIGDVATTLRHLARPTTLLFIKWPALGLVQTMVQNNKVCR